VNVKPVIEKGTSVNNSRRDFFRTTAAGAFGAAVVMGLVPKGISTQAETIKPNTANIEINLIILIFNLNNAKKPSTARVTDSQSMPKIIVFSI
jgi:hypothetical protein